MSTKFSIIKYYFFFRCIVIVSANWFDLFFLSYQKTQNEQMKFRACNIKLDCNMRRCIHFITVVWHEKKKPIGMAFIAASRPIFKWLWWAVPYLFFSIYFSVQMINYSVHRIWHWMIIIVCAWFDQQASMISHQTSTTIKAGKNHWNHFEYNIITNWFSGIGWMNGLAFVN